ncbi:MAG: caspase domain-containing protein [Chlorobium sp.]
MRLKALIVWLIICGMTTGFFVTTVIAAEKKAKKASSSDTNRGLKVVSKGNVRRFALVIGNSNYLHVGTLANPANDARLMAETLKDVGFELYGGKAQVNLNRDQMLTAIEDFGDRIGSGDVALFYYAGHGMQVKGENYLLPVNANIKSESEVRVKSVEAELLFAKLGGAKNAVNIVILDACRNNPFGRSVRSAGSGLAQVTAPSGTLVAFSTAPGQVAEDGTSGNSVYTRELAHAIKMPGLRIEDVFKKARVSVDSATRGKQMPWENTSLKGNFTFVGNETTNSSVAVFNQGANAESEAWQIIKYSSDPSDYKDFLDKFPNGSFNNTAKIKLRQLEKQIESNSDVSNPVSPTEVKKPAKKAKKAKKINPQDDVPPAAYVDRFVGRWTNENPNTSGITRVEIESRLGKVSVHMWGKCHPNDCDWGTTNSIEDNNDGILAVTWTMKFKTDKQQLSILENGNLRVSGRTHFTDNSGRPDYDSTHYFKRQ